MPRTSPVCSREEPGGTLQPTMKSWQLIAVVGDALQVRREKKALNAVREGERERDGWRAGSFCTAFLKPTDSRGRGWKRDGDRGRATEGRSVQIDILGCLWQRSRRQPLSNVHAERVAACAPPGLLIRIGTWLRMEYGKSKAAMEGCGCVCSA